MKLYNMNLSNFASRCRIAIHEKGAAVDIVPIPGGDLKSPEYLAVYPLGKTPALEMADGTVVGESEVIDEYLEEKFPQPTLLPGSAEDRARARGLSRFHDLYLEPPLRAMFPQIGAKERDEELIRARTAEVAGRLDELEKMLGDGPHAVGAGFSFADCALSPTIFFANLLLPTLGAPAFDDGRPKLAAWWRKVQERPSVAKVLGEQQEALAARRQSS